MEPILENIKPKQPLQTNTSSGSITPSLPITQSIPSAPTTTTTQSIKGHNIVVKRFIYIIIKGILTIIAVFVLYVAYKSYTSYHSTMAKANEIAGKWPEYRCQPSVMPFASQLTGGKVNTIANGIDCLITAYIKPYITSFITPFVHFFEKILEVIVDLVNSV